MGAIPRSPIYIPWVLVLMRASDTFASLPLHWRVLIKRPIGDTPFWVKTDAIRGFIMEEDHALFFCLSSSPPLCFFLLFFP